MAVQELSECRVLIVDDVKANVDMLVEALRGDFKLSVALDGEAALRAVEKSACSSPPSRWSSSAVAGSLSASRRVQRSTTGRSDAGSRGAAADGGTASAGPTDVAFRASSSGWSAEERRATASARRSRNGSTRAGSKPSRTAFSSAPAAVWTSPAPRLPATPLTVCARRSAAVRSP